MRRAVGNTLFVLAIVFVPLLLGALIVGPETPVGRNSRSATRVGHKALFLLCQQLGWDVRRFERGVETLPEGRATLIALEPGPALFRGKGAFAKSLIAWVETGNAALVTLGPDPDRPAELDDDEGELGAQAKRAIAIAEEIKKRAKERSDPRPAEEKEIGPAVAEYERAEMEADASWDSSELLDFLGLPLLEDRLRSARTSTIALAGAFAQDLDDRALSLTRPRVLLPHPNQTSDRTYDVLLSAEDRPLLIRIPLGKGELLLLSEPRLFQNAAIGRGAHARIAMRALDRLAEQTGSRVLWFEEFSHGAREASSVADLVLHTRARWPVLQLLLALLVWILIVAWRSRSVVPHEALPRRSRDEVIDAMASLFLRASDTRGAAARLAELTRRRLLRTLPPGAEAELTPLLAARVDRDPEEIAAALDPATVRSAKDLVNRAEELRALRVAADARK